MNENNGVTFYPFRMSGGRMRQAAQQFRRQGRALDALTLIRRAAEQEDTPAAWLNVAAELRSLGCWESALNLMGRVLAGNDMPTGTWMEMARCFHAVGQYPMALDCVYHQLHEDPWSTEGEAARDMLLELESGGDEKEPHRAAHLVKRGLTAWHMGERERGEKQIRRALRIVREPHRLLATAAMMCMLTLDQDRAMCYLTCALRHDPYDARTLIALSTLLYQKGRVRFARGMLQKAANLTDGIQAEEAYLTAAWAQDAWPEMMDFLNAALRRTPCRLPLLGAKAICLLEQGETAAAREIWRQMLAIDPDDRSATAMLEASLAGESLRMVPPDAIPAAHRIALKQEGRILLESGQEPADILQPGSRSRRVVDWLMTSGDGEETAIAQQFFLERTPETETYLRGLVAQPFLNMGIRRWALIRLAEMGCMDEMTMSMGEGFNTVQCQKKEERVSHAAWWIFLRSLLMETRAYRESREITEFAAGIWAVLTPRERRQASSSGLYAWCKAVEVLYLRVTGREEKSARAARNAAITARKISRVLRCIGAHIMME